MLGEVHHCGGDPPAVMSGPYGEPVNDGDPSCAQTPLNGCVFRRLVIVHREHAADLAILLAYPGSSAGDVTGDLFGGRVFAIPLVVAAGLHVSCTLAQEGHHRRIVTLGSLSDDSALVRHIRLPQFSGVVIGVNGHVFLRKVTAIAEIAVPARAKVNRDNVLFL